ncbi:hypothetical protein [Bacillus sp. Marseille-P3661]|uniref:hypothetical protein n=1 Tax=Bacillus sp. Marseille-P3661 TaxID=1936234 RepID=UPI0015E177D4|nr:hypothetical protein [Bacillus sp. Marseille-P3661]
MATDKQQKYEATVAPGIDDHEELGQKASNKDIAQHNTTKVTTLSYDETDPS